MTKEELEKYFNEVIAKTDLGKIFDVEYFNNGHALVKTERMVMCCDAKLFDAAMRAEIKNFLKQNNEPNKIPD